MMTRCLGDHGALRKSGVPYGFMDVFVGLDAGTRPTTYRRSRSDNVGSLC